MSEGGEGGRGRERDVIEGDTQVIEAGWRLVIGGGGV